MKTLLLATTALILLTTTVDADIVSTVGLTQISAPATVEANFLLAPNTPQVIFNEKQNVTLSAPLSVDTGSPIATGTIVNSYFMAVNSLNQTLANTSVTFDSLVLAIIFSDGPDPYNNPNFFNPNFANSNFLGAPSTTYNLSSSNCTFCGFEISAPDLDIASFSGNVVSFHNNYSIPGDFARIITSVASVPLPLAASGLPGLFGLFLAGLGLWSRRISKV